MQSPPSTHVDAVVRVWLPAVMTRLGGGARLRAILALVAALCASCGPPAHAPQPIARASEAPSAGASAAPSSDPAPTALQPFLTELSISPSESGVPHLRSADVRNIGEGFVLEEARPDGGASLWFMVDGQRIGPDLYAGSVRRDDLASPGLALWNAAGRVLRLDAHGFVAMDADRTELLAIRWQAPALFALPKTFGEMPTPIALGPVPGDTADWSPSTIAMLDATHVLYTTSIVYALPSLERVALFEGNLDGIGGRTALVRSANASGDLAFDVVDAFTDARTLTLELPSKERATPTTDMMGGGPEWVAGVSIDGRYVGIHGSSGLWITDLKASPRGWKHLDATPFSSFRGSYGLAFARDDAFVCTIASGIARVFAITGTVVAPPHTTVEASPMESSEDPRPRACELIFRPDLPGMEPLGYVNDKFYTIIQPTISDASLGWTAALYRAKRSTIESPGDVELVVFDPSVGKPIHRVVVGKQARPRNKGEEPAVQSMVVTPGKPGFVEVTIDVDGSSMGGTVDLRTGKIGAPPEVAPKWTAYCLHPDGALTAADTCSVTAAQ